MSNSQKYWCFSNHGPGTYGETDWDISTIIKSKRYYFNQAERNRPNISSGDVVLLRQYSVGFLGTCKIAVVIGQILRYMGYVRENWAKKEDKQVTGIILTPSFDEQLRLAAAEANIKVLRCRIG